MGSVQTLLFFRTMFLLCAVVTARLSFCPSDSLPASTSASGFDRQTRYLRLFLPPRCRQTPSRCSALEKNSDLGNCTRCCCYSRSDRITPIFPHAAHCSRQIAVSTAFPSRSSRQSRDACI